MKRVSIIFAITVLLLCLLPLSASAAHKYGTSLTGSNENDQNYFNWSAPVYSYMTTSSTGKIMTITHTSNGLEIAYYNTDYSLYKTQNIKSELPIWGGFYETENNYYVLTGQRNPAECPNVEVFRLTKYDKSWNRIKSVGLYDCNTVIPFDAGSARFTHKGNVLVIRTCHEMYQSSDGLNHQANLTFSVNTDSMSIIQSHYSVANINWGGYVSHSFNQFIRYDGNQLVAIDHGDAYPRAISLVKYNSSAFSTTSIGVDSVYSLLDIPGNIGANYTGVSIGGFEISSSSYLVAGNSALNTSTNGPRNIFVASLPRNGGSPKVTYITNYTSTDTSASTPHLVKLSDNYCMVLWSVNDYVYYTLIDHQGNKYGSTRKMKGSLSDCAPVVINKKVQWYTYNENDVTFYAISTSKLDSTAKKTINNGHKYVLKRNSTHHWQACSECGKVIDKVAHSNTEQTTYVGFDSKGNWVRACKHCKYPFKSYKVTASLKVTQGANGMEITPVLKTSARTLKYGVDYDYYKSSYTYSYDSQGRIQYKRLTLAFRDYSNYNYIYKDFISLSDYGSVGTIKTQAYTGKAIKPAVKVVVDGKTLKNGTDYTVTYKNNTKVGTATAIITGKNGYFGTIKKTFQIKKLIDVSTCKVKLSTTVCTYNGKVRTPSVTVKNANGTILKKGTHYTVSYASGRKNVGTYKVVVKMIGNYTGKKILYFKINPVKTTIEKLTPGTKKIIVNIAKKSSQVTGYQVQYSTSKAFTNAATKTISSYNTTKYTLSGLSAKKTYYVRVRTYKKVDGKTYYSGWSSYKYTKTK